jgi:hypothetical protein
MRDEDDLRFHYSVLPIDLFPWEKNEPPHPDMEQEALADIDAQLVEHLSAALQNRRDPRQALRIMVNAERIFREYVDAGFHSMRAAHGELIDHLCIAARMARRAIIRAALRDPADEVYGRLMQGLVSDDTESLEDVAAAERHLAEGTRLM